MNCLSLQKIDGQRAIRQDRESFVVLQIEPRRYHLRHRASNIRDWISTHGRYLIPFDRKDSPACLDEIGNWGKLPHVP